MSLAAHVIDQIFLVLLGVTALFYAACYVAPEAFSRIISLPYVFHLKWNFGRRALALQTVIYAVFHRRRANDVTHHLLLVEGVAWFVVAGAVGWPVGLALWVFLVAQAISFGERPLALLLAVYWTAAACIAKLALLSFDPYALPAAELLLVVAPLARTLTHAFEPLPPLVADARTMRFGPLRFQPNLLLTGPFGYLAELAAGLPFRLIGAQMHLLVLRLGARPHAAIALDETVEHVRELATGGFAAWSETRDLFAWFRA